MRNTYHSGLTASLFVVTGLLFQACGASQSIGEDILRVGGISSTGNKDDEDTEAQQQGKGEIDQPVSAPLECKREVFDLSKLRFEVAKSESIVSCGQDDVNLICLEVLTFHSKTQGTAYLRLDDGVLKAADASYESCGRNLSVSIKAGDDSLVLTTYEFSEDRSKLTNKETGVVYRLAQ